MSLLHIANKNHSSWSVRPWVLMKALGIPFQECLHRFDARPNPNGTLTFVAQSPSGRLPCLQVGELLVWDSLAITEYLAEHHPGVWPQNATARAFARSAAAEMHSGFGALREHCPMSCADRVAMTEWPAAVLADVQRIDSLWREGLYKFGGPYLAGAEFTAVDAFFVPVAFRALTYRLPFLPAAMAYANTLLNTPAVQAWYEQALQEAPDATHALPAHYKAKRVAPNAPS